MGKEIGEELSNKLQDASMNLWTLQNTIALHLGKDGRFIEKRWENLFKATVEARIKFEKLLDEIERDTK